MLLVFQKEVNCHHSTQCKASKCQLLQHTLPRERTRLPKIIEERLQRSPFRGFAGCDYAAIHSVSVYYAKCVLYESAEFPYFNAKCRYLSDMCILFNVVKHTSSEKNCSRCSIKMTLGGRVLLWRLPKQRLSRSLFGYLSEFLIIRVYYMNRTRSHTERLRAGVPCICHSAILDTSNGRSTRTVDPASAA